MKTSFITMTLTAALTLITFASQANTSTCFVNNSPLPSTVPKAICLRALDVGQSQGSVIVNTDLEDTNTKNLIVTSFVRHNEERAKFEVRAPLLSGKTGWDPACSEMEASVVVLKGEVDTRYTPEIHLENLTVSVEFTSAYDICHSHEETVTFDYVLRK